MVADVTIYLALTLDKYGIVKQSGCYINCCSDQPASPRLDGSRTILRCPSAFGAYDI